MTRSATVSLELPVFFPELGDLVGGGLASGIPGKALLAGLNELLVPLVEGGLLDGVLAAELRDGCFCPRCLHHDQDLLLGGEDPSGFPVDVLQVGLQ